MSVTAPAMVPIAKLRLWERNPRSISQTALDRLKQSMDADPDMLLARPCIALPDGRVVAGNMRLRAAQELGWNTVPTVYADLDENRAATWAMRDNNTYGEWDELALAEMLREMEEAQVDLDLTGFVRDDLDRLLDTLNEPAGPPADRGLELALSDVSIGDPNHEVERGQLWRVGRHTLAVVGIYDGWPTWAPLLEDGDLFVPYPTPTLPLGDRAERSRLVLVQPDPWLAGHLLDKYAAVRGEDGIELIA